MIKVKIKVLQKQISEKHYLTFEYEGAPGDSVAKVLNAYNEKAGIRGEDEISWECSCMVNKCGACAMRINGVPRLACSAFLHEFKDGEICLEPLSKFPHVKDLVVDRSVLFDSLKRLEIFRKEAAKQEEKTREMRYASSGCLNCGCCLEVCPNFNAKKAYTASAAAVNAYRVAADTSDKSHLKKMKKLYAKYYYEGCGLSLACHDICPAGLPVEELISRSNAVFIWGRRA